MDKNGDDVSTILRGKLESVGFVFEREQAPHFQPKRGKELKFTHPKLIDKFSREGLSIRAKLFYIKPLSDGEGGDIGFTTGKTSPLVENKIFQPPNTLDTFNNTVLNAWINEDSNQALDKLLSDIKNYLMPSLDDVLEDFSYRVSVSLSDSAVARKKRLENSPRKPEKIKITTFAYRRNDDVVAEVLLRAAGKCESCGSNAPFVKKADNTPYLEVHHEVPLSEDGDDTIENAIALCPNCHRECHYG